MAHSRETIMDLLTVSLEHVARTNRGTPTGDAAEEMLAKHLARMNAETLTHGGLSYVATVGEA